MLAVLERWLPHTVAILYRFPTVFEQFSSPSNNAESEVKFSIEPWVEWQLQQLAIQLNDVLHCVYSPLLLWK